MPARRDRLEACLPLNVAAIILAAGRSSRFGRPKQLARFESQALVRRAATAALDAACRSIVVVVGAQAAEITPELAGLSVAIVVNADWRDGLGSSIRAGTRHLIDSAGEIEGVLLLACDQPLVRADTLRQIIALHQATGKPIVASAYANTLGIPALFDRSCFAELLTLRGDRGANQSSWPART